MMKRIKHWLYSCFLPVWAKEQLLRENEQLRQKIKEQENRIRELNSYIAGLEAGIRNQRRIVINAGGGKQ